MQTIAKTQHQASSSCRSCSRFLVSQGQRCFQPRAAASQKQCQQPTTVSRREGVALLSLVACLEQLRHQCTPVYAADAVETSNPASEGSSTTSSSSSLPSTTLEPFLDQEYRIEIPSNYKYKEIPYEVKERGPQPERSPVLARFEAEQGVGYISILRRRAASIKPMLLQVTDVAQYGNPVEVAKLLLPRGAVLLSAATTVERQAARDTPVGELDIPPKTYYKFEFKTNNGLSVAMVAAAQRGMVFVVGAAVPTEEWEESRGVLRQVVDSFRLRDSTNIFNK